MKRIAIKGAGAAGCFCAAEVRRRMPSAVVDVYEAGARPLAKVAVTGGGRCNLTNTFAGLRSLAEAYPRGERVMKRALKAFSQEDAREWFAVRGVPTVVQEDQCVFPRSQDAMDVVRALLRAMDGATLHTRYRVSRLSPEGGTWRIGFTEAPDAQADAVVVTTGGAAKGLPFLDGLGLEIVPPVPSLFTFTIREDGLRALMGLVVDASVGLPGTSFRAEGSLLVTDWGLSGPAVLKLSSYAARHLAGCGYRAPLSVRWLRDADEAVRTLAATHPHKQITTVHPDRLPGRLWTFLTARAGLRDGLRWAELGNKGFHRLVAVLTGDTYSIEGKSRFREEFVTAGGVDLSNINLSTLECKALPGLYFAGEVLDIDAVTGGFNLQAAWSTGYAAARSIAL